MIKKNKQRNKPELLAPAGDSPMLVAAVKAGADAVYFGLKEFSMRQNAGNFTLRDLDKIEKICKPLHVKKYLTLNTIIYDNEIPKIEKMLKRIKNKIDAVICWDSSVIRICRKNKIPFHISTQASVANSEAAKFYKQIGAERIVLARELNLKQIKKISRLINVECFVHGAMCVSVSGRCLLSQFLFNKSANRGECLHPCRRSYIVKKIPEGSEQVQKSNVKYIIRDKQEGYELEVQNNKILSAKDLCTLPFIEKLKKAGVRAFKIEGRNRDARYVDAVVRVYRKALDKKLTKEEIKAGIEELKKVYNKGFSSGFYLGLPTSDDFAGTEHSEATEKKHFVGKITNYFSKIGVATVKLVSELKVGDEVIVMGNSTGIERTKVERLEINNKSVDKGKKGEEIGLKLPKVRKNNEVYIIIKQDKKII